MSDIDTGREAVERLLKDASEIERYTALVAEWNRSQSEYWHTRGCVGAVAKVTALSNATLRALLDERDAKDGAMRASESVHLALQQRAKAAEKERDEAVSSVVDANRLIIEQAKTIVAEIERAEAAEKLVILGADIQDGLLKIAENETARALAAEKERDELTERFSRRDQYGVFRGKPMEQGKAVRYDEIAAELDAASSKEGFSYISALLDRAASALREAQQRPDILQTLRAVISKRLVRTEVGRSIAREYGCETVAQCRQSDVETLEWVLDQINLVAPKGPEPVNEKPQP